MTKKTKEVKQATVASQTTWLPAVPPSMSPADIAIEDLVDVKKPDFVGPKPRPSFIASIRRWGILERVLVVKTPDGYRIKDGRRRVRAMLELFNSGPDDQWEGVPEFEGDRAVDWKTHWGTIPCEVITEADFATDLVSVVTNEQRGENVAVILSVIERMVDAGLSENDIVSKLGIPHARLGKIMKLSALHPALRKALDEDKISQTVAEDCSRLPQGMQEQLAKLLDEKGELTAPMVKEARQARREEAQEAMGGLFPEAPPEYTPVSGKDILISKVEECVNLAQAQHEFLAKAHLERALQHLKGLIMPPATMEDLAQLDTTEKVAAYLDNHDVSPIWNQLDNADPVEEVIEDLAPGGFGIFESDAPDELDPTRPSDSELTPA